MAKYSKLSNERLSTCHPDLQLLFNAVVQHIDCTIICGHRGEEEQNNLYERKLSQKKYPDSKHNTDPSVAVDVSPYPIDWNEAKPFYFFAGFVKAMAIKMGIRIRWGGDWDGDYDFKDQKFMDLVHFELMEE